MKLALILGAALAAAQEMTAPPAPQQVSRLREAFIEAVASGRKREILSEIGRTAPTSVADVQALYDLFMRFPEQSVRQAALDSLQRIDPVAGRAAEPLLLRAIQDEEAESRIFGVKGAFLIRSPQALPVIKNLAKKKFRAPAARDLVTLGERNDWWVQYEALAALAQWEGEKALPLLRRKTGEAPEVARLMGLYLWELSLPDLEKWSRGKASDVARAEQGLNAPAPKEALRATRERMLAIVRDAKAPISLRHPLALKAGACATPEEAASLLREHDAAADPQTKTLLAAAAFASRDPQVAPLLLRYAKENPEPRIRAGALVQLRDILPPLDYRALLEWVVQNDPDLENKENARRELQ